MRVKLVAAGMLAATALVLTSLAAAAVINGTDGDDTIRGTPSAALSSVVGGDDPRRRADRGRQLREDRGRQQRRVDERARGIRHVRRAVTASVADWRGARTLLGPLGL